MAPGSFDVILPVRVGYDLLKEKLAQAIAAMPQVPGISVKNVDVYPSSGKLVIGLRVARAADADADAGKWIYLSTTGQNSTPTTRPVGLAEIDGGAWAADSQVASAGATADSPVEERP